MQETAQSFSVPDNVAAVKVVHDREHPVSHIIDFAELRTEICNVTGSAVILVWINSTERREISLLGNSIASPAPSAGFFRTALDFLVSRFKQVATDIGCEPPSLTMEFIIS